MEIIQKNLSEDSVYLPIIPLEVVCLVIALVYVVLSNTSNKVYWLALLWFHFSYRYKTYSSLFCLPHQYFV